MTVGDWPPLNGVRIEERGEKIGTTSQIVRLGYRGSRIPSTTQITLLFSCHIPSKRLRVGTIYALDISREREEQVAGSTFRYHYRAT